MQGAMNTPHVIDFMQRLTQDSTRKVMLVLDNLKAHHAKEVNEWLKKHQDRIEVFYLPPYAPQSNPDEYFNEDFKNHLRSAERSASGKEALLTKAENFMRFLRTLCSLPGRLMGIALTRLR